MTNDAAGAATFQTTANNYQAFMGRYSEPLAVRFADWIGIAATPAGIAATPAGIAATPAGIVTALDVGCGPGAMTTVLSTRLGAGSVSACDPSPPFVEECAGACPGVEVRFGRAEAIPFDDAMFDVAVAQLVVHFVSDPAAAARELRRVVKPGGTVAACIWSSPDGMDMLERFWDAVAAAGLTAPPDARVVRFGGLGEIVALFDAAGLVHTAETTIDVSSSYHHFDELWSGLAAGIGPAGAFCAALEPAEQATVRAALSELLGSPTEGFELFATARCARGTVPD